MKFRRYQHIERFGNDEVAGIEDGTCYVFPKIDGTNASIYMDNEPDASILKAGSRKRELTLDSDNAGFDKFVQEELFDKCKTFFNAYPNLRLYGEWLVPHTIKNYLDDAWKKFYVFDVVAEFPLQDNSFRYLSYDEYQPLMEQYGFEYIPPLKIVTDADLEKFLQIVETNDYLMQGGNIGEGIVIKNYDYKNKYGNVTWAKIVRSEFKTNHCKAMGAPEVSYAVIESQIAEKYVTKAFVEKEYAKVIEQEGHWNSKMIPMFLGRIWYEFVNEEMWHAVKTFKNPTIDFKKLNRQVILQIKKAMPELF